MNLLLERAIFDDPAYQSVPDEFLSRDEVYSESVRKSALAFLKRDEIKHLLESQKNIRLYNG